MEKAVKLILVVIFIINLSSTDDTLKDNKENELKNCTLDQNLFYDKNIVNMKDRGETILIDLDGKYN